MMRSPALTELLNTAADLVSEAEAPTDPFEQANLLAATERISSEALALAQRIVTAEHTYRAGTTLQQRLDRQPYRPPARDPEPRPADPPPSTPPATPAPKAPKRGGK